MAEEACSPHGGQRIGGRGRGRTGCVWVVPSRGALVAEVPSPGPLKGSAPSQESQTPGCRHMLGTRRKACFLTFGPYRLLSLSLSSQWF